MTWFIVLVIAGATGALLIHDDPGVNVFGLVMFGIWIILATIIYRLSRDLKMEKQGISAIAKLIQLPEAEVHQRYETIYHENSQVPVKMRLEATAKFFGVELPF